jgi:hypothetical protein
MTRPSRCAACWCSPASSSGEPRGGRRGRLRQPMAQQLGAAAGLPARGPAHLPSPAPPAPAHPPRSYSSYYLTRNSLTYTAPVMVADPRLGMDITQIGAPPPAACRLPPCACTARCACGAPARLARAALPGRAQHRRWRSRGSLRPPHPLAGAGAMTSVFPIAYGMSKFVSGVLGAKFSPTVLLAGGLMATAIVNIAFGFGTGLAWFCGCWALNGMLQVRGPAAPARPCSACAARRRRTGPRHAGAAAQALLPLLPGRRASAAPAARASSPPGLRPRSAAPTGACGTSPTTWAALRRPWWRAASPRRWAGSGACGRPASSACWCVAGPRRPGPACRLPPAAGSCFGAWLGPAPPLGATAPLHCSGSASAAGARPRPPVACAPTRARRRRPQVGVFVLIAVKDKPEDIGHPPVEPEAPKKKSERLGWAGLGCCRGQGPGGRG